MNILVQSGWFASLVVHLVTGLPLSFSRSHVHEFSMRKWQLIPTFALLTRIRVFRVARMGVFLFRVLNLNNSHSYPPHFLPPPPLTDQTFKELFSFLLGEKIAAAMWVMMAVPFSILGFR
jgi:hypothetical protein